MEERTNQINDYIFSLLGNNVIVQLHDLSEYSGELISIDGLLNIALDKASLIQYNNSKSELLGETFIRGNNILCLYKS